MLEFVSPEDYFPKTILFCQIILKLERKYYYIVIGFGEKKKIVVGKLGPAGNLFN